MAGKLNQVRIGFLERRHPPGHRGALADQLVPLLREQGARLDVVHSEEGLHRLNERPAWDVVVLKSGSAAALHLAAAAESWGIPCVNSSEATRLAQDKLANAAILQQAGLPIAPVRMVWLGPDGSHSTVRAALDALAGRKLIVKAARGSRGAGLWVAEPGGLPDLAARIPAGPYLLMDYVAHSGDDLKVFVAGPWQAAIERPFPARSYEDKLGRPVEALGEVTGVAREAGRLLGLSCFGCDFVRAANGWTLVDVNAFPGYKGAGGAAEAIAAEIARVAAGGPA